MLKLFSYLRGSLTTVIIIVLLLCVQAMADLALPDFTSKIVNTGIQSGGIENQAPEVIRESQMENLLIFTEDDDQILEDYTLISKDNLDQKDYEKYVEDYPELANQNLYLQNKLKANEQEELNSLIEKPLIMLSYIQNEETANALKQQILENVPASQSFYFTNLSLIEIIKSLPENTLNQMLGEYKTKVDQMQDTILDQAAISAVKTEYQAIGVNLDNLQNGYIVKKGLQMLGVALISMTTAVIIILLSARIAARLGKILRNKVFKKVLSFSTKEFSEFSVASLITRNTNDIQQIQMLIVILFRVVVYSPIMGIGGFVKVLNQGDSSMAWIIGLAVLAIMFIVGTLFMITMPKFKKLQELTDKINQVAREILTGLPVIRAFNTEKKEEARFDVANKNLMKTNVFVNRTMSIMMPAMMFVMNSVMILIVWFGGKNVDSGVIQVGDMMAFIQYTMYIVMSFLMISMVSIMLPRAQVSAKRINEVLDTKLSIEDPENPKKFDETKKGLVEFKNVSFRYPDADEEILHDIDFTAEPGKTTAIIGSTGSGKSTIINLLPRFYDVTEGELCVDGVNVKEVRQKDLRDIIGIVPQKGMLFSGTIESNIKYADENMSDEKMIQAAEIAQATEFISKKPKGYKDEIAQGGSNVSGGQKQRLAIARAIAKDPEIFIFDDSFSALDLKTDAQLREALATKTKNKTVIIVAQRISTILNADKIVVLDEGSIVGIGTHKELMETNETYRTIALSQMSEEELKQEGSDK